MALTCLETRVSGWKDDMYKAVGKTFSARNSVRDQVAGKTRENAQREAEEGRRRREQEAREKESSDNMFAFYGARPPPGQFFESS
ncbi:hypothetical protein FALBO_15345 [Fusarium albosuccineum]|uniref:Uncharacterized protein n=1 Tax=Fusarium albosuccineum TaxID=1237068 RepID=A0A8H4P2H7_9HYPO|nr:hypothetical protein FALBO_15345 [Fusarium albosuccineum]